MKYFSILFFCIPPMLLGVCLILAGITGLIWGKKKRLPKTGIALGGFLITACFVWLQTEGILGLGVNREFTPEAWAETKPEDRHFMMESLMDSVSLIGITGKELRVLLGDPDYIDTPELMEYLIDKPFDAATLDFTLENGVVTNIGVTTEH